MATNNSINSSTIQVLPLAGGTMTGAINMGSNKINSVTDPTSAQDAATKNYVDTVAAGLNPKEAVAAATTANLVGTYVNGVSGVGATFTMTATGTQTIDGQTVTVNYNYLLKNQSSGFQNGVYTCTTAGAGGVASIFTRATNYNTAGDMNAGDLIPVISGTANANSAWLQSAIITTVGTDNLVFTQFGSASPLTTKGDIWGYDTANNRIPVGTNLQIVQADSTASLGVSYTWPAFVPSITDYMFDESRDRTYDKGTLLATSAGTGSGQVNVASFDITRPGITTVETGTTTTGRSQRIIGAGYNDQINTIYFGSGIYTYETDVYLQALSDGTNTYTLYIGFMQSQNNNGTPANGVYFTYTNGTNSGNWVLNSSKASSNSTSNTSTAALVGWQKLTITVNAANTLATFYINGTSVGTLNSNLPVVALNGSNSIVKSAGTTSRILYIDYMYLATTLTTQR